MSRYIVMRLGQGVLTLFVLATLVFTFSRLIGNPVDMLLPPDATPAEREFMIKGLGLDRPYHEQYGEFIWGLLRGDVGKSIKYGKPVVELFLQRFPNTVRLAAAAMTIALVVGVTLGMVSALHKDSALDHLARLLSVFGMSAPKFWVGLMLMLLFAVTLGLLPVARMGGLDSYVLPAFTLSLTTLAGTARLVRSSMVDVLDSEFVKLARIKGVSANMVVWKHCLRNALLPVMTFAGAHLALLLNGSVVIESIFAWPGVGRLIYDGIVSRDYPLVQGCLLIVGFMIVIINLAVDTLYAYVDPRIRFNGGK